MNPLQQLVNDMREKRLWIPAAVLLVAIIAIPVLLSKSSSAPPAPSAPQPSASAPQGPDVPSVTAQTAAIHSKLTGRSRDPFLQQVSSTSSNTAAPGTTATTGGSGTPSTSTTPSSSSTTTTTATGGSGTSSTPTSGSGGSGPKLNLPPSKPKPAPAGLRDSEAYNVTLAITNDSGGFDTINSLQRLSVLPSTHQPLLVELGVLKGGNRVLFAVQPGTVVSGPGTCVPGPVSCEILSLAPGQIEGLGTATSTGVTPVAEFAVTEIGVGKFSSAAAAMRARESESAAGRQLLDRSASSTLSLFSYNAGIGAVVDMRNLIVGGN